MTMLKLLLLPRSSVSKLSKRILLLESDRQIMQKAMDDIRRDLRELAKGLDDFEVRWTSC